MKILVDENMPYAAQLFGRLGEVQSVTGRAISRQLLSNVDALMVRSITKVNAQLLAGTGVKFVGSATAGVDHIDQDELAELGITFCAAPGCNAVAVVEYVFSALLSLAERDGFRLSDKSVGIIGVGQVGQRLQQRLQACGVKTWLCDPPRADRGDTEIFCSLEKIVAEADILTFHTPLNLQGPYANYHMVDAELLAALPDGRILINASRGAIIDNRALLNILNKGKRISVVLDVWEAEPDLLLPLLDRVDIATAHIAGYSLEGKTRGTVQIYQAFSQTLNQTDPIELNELLPRAEFSQIKLHGTLNQERLKRLIYLVYDVRRDDAALRRMARQQGGFDYLRKYYPERREWSSLHVQSDDPASQAWLQKLGFSTSVI